jgi:hypothetical protein
MIGPFPPTATHVPDRQYRDFHCVNADIYVMLTAIVLLSLALPIIPPGGKPAVGTAAYVTASFPQRTYAQGVAPREISLVPVHTQTVGSHTGNAGDGSAEFLKVLPNGLVAVCNDKGGAIDFYKLKPDGSFALANSVRLIGSPQSATVANGVVIVAVDTGYRSPDGGPRHGKLAVFALNQVEGVSKPLFYLDAGGYLPDHVSFSPSGRELLVAIEAEPTTEGPWFDAVGGVTIFRATDWACESSYTSTFVGFDSLVGDEECLLQKGVHMPMVILKNSTVAQSLEPEYIAYASDSSKAYVALQEANAIAVLDLSYDSFTEIRPLGFKSLSTSQFDVSDRDGALGNFNAWPNAWSMFQPDTMHTYHTRGRDYIITANEGDAQNYIEDREDAEAFVEEGASEEARCDDLNLDPTAFPNAAALQQDAQLGRYKVSTVQGVKSGTPGVDAVYDRIVG